MNKKQITAMIHAILRAADEDLADFIDPRTSEDPEYAEELLAELVGIAMTHLAEEHTRRDGAVIVRVQPVIRRSVVEETINDARRILAASAKKAKKAKSRT